MAKVGGARAGSGRKPGTANVRTREIADAIAKDGKLLPLEYMLNVMRDETSDAARRDDMAKAAAPFIHPRLAAVEHTGANGGPIETKDVSEISDLEGARRIAFVMAEASLAINHAKRTGNAAAKESA